MKVSTCSIATGLGSKEQIQPTVENWSDTWVLKMKSKLDRELSGRLKHETHTYIAV